MNQYARLGLLVATLSAIALAPAFAAPTGVDLGTGNPPATLGSYTMMAYDPGSIAGAQQGTMAGGSDTGTAKPIWATWGQDYTGNIYVVDDSGSAGFSDTVTITLGAGTQAVYFYEEPNQFLDFSMTATDSSGVAVSTVINGFHGSSAVGFYETDTSDFLTKITVTASDPTGFAIGEFGVNVGGSLSGGVGGGTPDAASTLLLLGVSLAGLVALRRKLPGLC